MLNALNNMGLTLFIITNKFVNYLGEMECIQIFASN